MGLRNLKNVIIIQAIYSVVEKHEGCVTKSIFGPIKVYFLMFDFEEKVIKN